MKIKEYQKNYYKVHKEHIKQLKQNWYVKNREMLLKRDKDYKEKNREHINEVRKLYPSYSKYHYQKRKKYSEMSPSELVLAKARAKLYYKPRSSMTQTQRDIANAKSRAYYHKSKTYLIPYYFRRRMLKNRLGGSFSIKEWEEVKNKQNNLCFNCKLSKPLTIDHIIPISKWEEWAKINNPSFLCSDIQNIQALCHHCNCVKNDTL